MCLPAVSVFSARVFGMMYVPSSVIRRGAEPPAPLATVSVGSLQARIGEGRGQGLRLEDLAVDDLRQVHRGAAEVVLRQRARQRDVRRRGGGRGVTTLAIFTVSALGPLIELERVAGGAARQAREPDLRVTGRGRRSARRRVVRLHRRRRRAPDGHGAVGVDQRAIVL